MKELLLDQMLEASKAGGETLQRSHTRRNFLKGLGLVVGTMLVKPGYAFTPASYGAEGWKLKVCELVGNICPEPSARRIRRAIYSANVYTVAPSGDIHERNSANYIINLTISPEQTDGGRYFEFERLPFYDSQNPCRRTKDLNALELNRILQPGEIEFYGGVLSPCSQRRYTANTCELEDYRRTTAYYKQDASAWTPIYTRNFTDGRKSYLAHAVTPRTNAQGQPLKQLLLSPDSF